MRHYIRFFLLINILLITIDAESQDDKYRIRFTFIRTSTCTRCEVQHTVKRADTPYPSETDPFRAGDQHTFYTDFNPHSVNWLYRPRDCGPTWNGTNDYCTNWDGNDVTMSLSAGSPICGSQHVLRYGNQSGFMGIEMQIDYSAPRHQAPYNFDGSDQLDNICSETDITLATSNWLVESYSWEVSASADGPFYEFQFNPATAPNGHLVTVNENTFSSIPEIGKQNAYYVRVKDTGGCFFDRTSPAVRVTFVKSAPDSFTWRILGPSCPGGNDSRLEITSFKNGAGGTYSVTEPLTYAIERIDGLAIQADNWISSHSPLTYSPVILTHENGENGFDFSQGRWRLSIETEDTTGNCLKQSDFNTYDPPTPSISAPSISSPILCPGGSGSLSVSVSPVSSKYRMIYSLVNETTGEIRRMIPLIATTFSFNNVKAGRYHWVVEIEGCPLLTMTSTPITISDPTGAIAISNASSTNISCKGNSDGSISIQLTGGETEYSYALGADDFQSFSGNSITIPNLAEGNYTVRLADDNNCQIAEDFDIGAPAPLQLSANVSVPIRCTGGEGQIQVNCTGGVGPFDYALISGGSVIQEFTNQNGRSFQFLPVVAGNYAIRVIGCGELKGIVQEINDPATPISITSVTPQNISCAGEFDGQITVDISGGSAPYIIRLANRSYVSVTGTSHTFRNLTDGQYSFTVRDDYNCEVTSNATIGAPTPLSLLNTTISKEIECTNGEGNISVTIADGVAPFSYRLFGPDGQIQSSLNRTERTHIFTGIPANSYTIGVTGCGNEVVNSGTIDLLPAADPIHFVSLTSSNALCTGSSDGQITANIAGGSGVYEIQIGTADFVPVTDTAHTFNGISPGDYTVQIRDGHGCTTSENITVASPESVAISSWSVSEAITCLGGNGSLQVSAQGGAIDYRFDLSGDAFQTATVTTPTYIFDNLPSGSYQVTVTSCGQTDQSTMLDLDEPTDLVSITSSTSVNATCSTSNDGQITVNVSGGTPGYSIALGTASSVPMTGSSHTFSGLTNATYSFTVFDNNGCSVVGQASVGLHPAITGSIDPQNITQIECHGFDNGFVFIDASGGGTNTSYEFSINSGAFQASNFFGNLAAQTHNIVVRDANATSCSWTGNFDITQPTPLSIDALSVSNNVSCFGLADGSIHIETSGGPSAHSYQLFLGQDLVEEITGQSTYDFEQLVAGNYRVVVSTSVTGCDLEESTSITQPNQLAVSGTSSDYNGFGISCDYTNDGSVILTSSGGTFPHTYSVSGQANQVLINSNDALTFDGFGAGDFAFDITDANGCSIDTSVTLSAPSAVVVSNEVAVLDNGLNISCHGASDGSLTAFVGGGVGPYSISMNGSNTVSVIDSNVFAGLVAGSYRITVSDANGCNTSDSTGLTQPDELVIEEIVLSHVGEWNLACFNDSSATATVSILGGSAPFNYSLINHSNIDTSSLTEVSFDGLGRGDYSLQITDSEGCATSADFTISAPALLTLDPTQTVIIKPECGGDQTGSIQVQAIGGIPTTGNYAYTLTYINPPNDLPFPVEQLTSGDLIQFDQLIGGNYLMTVSDSNGCMYSEAINVNTNQQLQLDISGSTLSCKSDDNGTGEVTIQGGSAPYDMTVLLDNNPIIVLDGLTENNPLYISNLTEGDYHLNITDTNGCTYLNDEYIIQVVGPEQALELVTTSTNVSCFGGSNGAISLSAVGGWDSASLEFGIDINNLTPTDTLFGNLAPGTYSFFVQDSAGCVASADAFITEPEPLLSRISGINEPLCFGDSTGSFEVTISGGTVPYLLSIDNEISWTTEQTFDSLSAKAYTINIQDSLGCFIEEQVSIEQPQALSIELVDLVHTQCQQATGSAEVAVSGGTSAYNYSWTNPDSDTISVSTSAQDLAAATYTFITSDQHGCLDTFLVDIINTDDMDVEVTILNHVSCYDENDGNAAVIINDIIEPYTINWSDGSTTDKVTTLGAGDHSVEITDATGCLKSFDFLITEPEPLLLTLKASNPSCHGICDGTIISESLGGTLPYSYSWNTGSASDTIESLCAGSYSLTVTDSNSCSLTESVILTEPTPLTLPIADSIFQICEGQNANIALPQFVGHQWTYPNGNIVNSTSINTTDIGQYTVTVVDTNFCVIEANFEVAQSSAVFNAEFLVPKETFVGDTIVCVSLSKPIPENLTWHFDNTYITQISADSVYQQLVFEETGEYELSITAQLGLCTAEQTKTIIVLEKSLDEELESNLGFKETGIKSANLFPNPNEGSFDCAISLFEKGNITISVYDEMGNTVVEHQVESIGEATIHIAIDNPQSGIYFMIVRTNDDSHKTKFILE